MAGTALSLAEFIAFNDQLAAFARLGVPLQEGLRELAGHGSSGLQKSSSGGEETLVFAAGRGSNRLQKFCLEIGGRVERGQTLADAIGEIGKDLPPSYRLLIEAGARTGNLSGALAATSRSAKRIEQLRRLMTTASIYPLILCLLAWGLTFAFVLPMLGQYQRMYVEFRTETQAWELRLFELARAAQGWWWIFPVLVLAVIARLWIVGTSGKSTGPWTMFVPGLRGISRDCEIAASCELLAAGVEHALPLSESLPLVSATVTDPELKQELERFSSGIGRGDAALEGAASRGTRLLPWLLARQGDGVNLAAGLRQVSAQAHDRVRSRVRWLSLRLPVIFAVVTGCVVVGAYALLVFGPLIQFWKDLVI